MSVINIKVANIRPKYKDLAEWMGDPNNVYIGRKGIVFINGERYPKQDSIWHNPFKIDSIHDRNYVIQQYEIYIRNKINENSQLKQELLKLKGKNLGCWCSPEKCHGDILLKLIEEFNK